VLHLALAILKISNLLRKGERKGEAGEKRKGIAKGTDGESLVHWVSHLAH
jgi:hypothetical protein